LSFIAKGIGIPARRLFAITIINAGTLSWYMYFANSVGSQIVFKNFTNNLSLISVGEALFFLTAGVSAFIGVLLSKRINNKRFLFAWILFGVLSSAMILFFKGDIFIFIFGPLLGIAMGLGFPYTYSLLASHTELEQRGRVSGIMLFETFAFAVLAGFVTFEFNFGITGTVTVLVVLMCTRFLGLATGEISSTSKSADQLSSMSRIRIQEKNKTFLMYLIPWILFITIVVLIDHVVWPSLAPSRAENPQIYDALHGPPYTYVGSTIVVVVAGFLADRFGRKIPIFIGLGVLGLSTALLSTVVRPETAFIHHMAIGIAFGFLMTAYSAIPGDLSEKFNAQKFYALTIVPAILIYFGLGSLPQYFGASATAISISWILTSLIFCSIVPVYLAKETLKEEKMRERQIKEYIRKLGKLVQDSKKHEK
jgi:MFS family permease